MSWQQEGFLVISDARGMPLFHGFFLPRWEAEIELEKVKKMPEELSYGATIVPARLWFDWRGTPKASSAPETSAESAADACMAKVREHFDTRRSGPCDCEGPQKIGPGYHAPYCATMAGTEFAKRHAPTDETGDGNG